MHHLHRLKEKIMPGDSKPKGLQLEKTQSTLYPSKGFRSRQDQFYEETGSRVARNQSQPLSNITNITKQRQSIQSEGAILTHSHQHSLPMTLMSSLPREELESYLKEANKKLYKKYREKGCLNQEDVYIIKIKWLCSMIKAQRKQHRRDLTGFRLNIEKVVEEVSLALDTHLFQSRIKVVRQLKRLGHFLSKLEPQKAILLSYKLFKMHLKQLNIDDKETKEEVASKCYNFFIPYTRLMDIEMQSKEKIQKRISNFLTYQKIKKFLSKHAIADILLKNPDPKYGSSFQQNFEVFLNEKISLQKAMSVMTCKTYAMLISESCIGLVDSQINQRKPEQVQINYEGLEDTREDHRHLENAKTIELDENNDIISTDRQGLYFGDKTGKKESPYEHKKMHHQKLPKEINTMRPKSSDEDSSGMTLSDNSLGEVETDNELMNDPDLYSQKKQVLHPPSPKNDNRFATKTASKFKVECTSETTALSGIQGQHNQAPMSYSRPSYEKKNSGAFRDSTRASDDLQLKVDPLRTSRHMDLIRVNSSHDLVALDNETTLIEELEKPPERSYKKRPSVVHKQLTVTKTKQDIVFQKVLSIANDETSKWDVLVNTPTLKVMKIKPEDSPVVLLKAWALIEGFNVQEVFSQIYDTENRSKWDTVTVGLRVVEPLTETSAVIYFYVKTPFGISERDFVQRRNFAKDYPEKGMITMSFESCEHPGAPVMKKRIRGETHIAGYLLKPCPTKPNATELIILSQVDIKGNIPKSIVNMVAGKAPAEWVSKLKKACERGRLGKH